MYSSEGLVPALGLVILRHGAGKAADHVQAVLGRQAQQPRIV